MLFKATEVSQIHIPVAVRIGWRRVGLDGSAGSEIAPGQKWVIEGKTVGTEDAVAGGDGCSLWPGNPVRNRNLVSPDDLQFGSHLE